LLQFPQRAKTFFLQFLSFFSPELLAAERKIRFTGDKYARWPVFQTDRLPEQNWQEQAWPRRQLPDLQSSSQSFSHLYESTDQTILSLARSQELVFPQQSEEDVADLLAQLFLDQQQCSHTLTHYQPILPTLSAGQYLIAITGS
jgi:hypothetical protein